MWLGNFQRMVEALGEGGSASYQHLTVKSKVNYKEYMVV